MGSLSNHSIFDIAQFYNLKLIDVVQKDLLKNTPQVNNGFYIINNQSSTEGNGTHWVALYLSKNLSFFFDSYGAPPPEDVVEYVKKFNSKHLYFNNFIIQNLNSDNCGYFCIAFILFVQNKSNKDYSNVLNIINEFINYFDENTKRNDRILEALFRMFEKNKSNKEIKKLYKQN